MEHKDLNTGELLKDMRERKGHSLAYVGRKVGTSGARIAQYEKQSDSRMSTISKIADALGYEIVIRPKQRQK